MIKQVTLLVAILLILTLIVAAADTTTTTSWKKSLVLDVTTTQAAYSDSWVGGEIGSLNWVANMNGTAEKQMAKWFNYRSILKLSFGQTVTQDDSTKKWSKPKKSTDLIDWDNLGRLTLESYVDPYVAFHLESQFSFQLSEEKTVYFSPMKLTESFGIARKFYSGPKTDAIISRLGFAVRHIITKQLVTGSPTETKSVTTNDGGIESVTDVQLTLNEKLVYISKLGLYKAFFFSEKSKFAGTPQANDWKTIDVNWENSVTAQLSKIIATKLYVQLLYDKQISYRGRLKETLGIGFLFNLI
ncbi:hypothetical protein C3F09_11330 [candidate division GN15 bacterium]|uniref:DUF3078 domain-containing protein n=1 Tax=candidate division GN15 bacterium TaxID=2072418 RepID=A0A855X2Y5_9BACT|nr:MAG: hypothetical protein C3F09_11330 [candidate division GN15 bacterium]